MPEPGSGGNVIAALASFFIPGLGQLLQGRVWAATIDFVCWIALLVFAIAGLLSMQPIAMLVVFALPVLHIIVAVDAARWTGSSNE